LLLTVGNLKKKCDVGMTYNDVACIKDFHENQSGLSTHESRDNDIRKWTQVDDMVKSHTCCTSWRREIG
jgi:hypothetical protein